MPAIKRQQNLILYTLQHTGSMETLFTVAQANGIGITDDVAPGTELLLPAVYDKKMTTSIAEKKRNLITNITD